MCCSHVIFIRVSHLSDCFSLDDMTQSHELEFGLNEWLVEEQHERYLHDPGSVDQAWRDLFTSSAPAPDRERHDPGTVSDHAVKAVRVAALIHAYRVRGHLIADTDPLAAERRGSHPELDITAFGLGDEDLERMFVVDGFAGRVTMSLRDVLRVLRESYCRTVGTQYMHIQSAGERRWVQRRIESPPPGTDRAEQLQILYRLGAAEALETFLHTKYVGQKRYSLEGGESAIVLLDALLHRCIKTGVSEAVIGMAHRGRLNVLANIVGKSYAEIFHEFEDAVDIRSVQGSGDVKYHLGAEGTYRALNGDTIAVSVVANPSHLEIVGPVAQGVVRAKQEVAADGADVLPIVIHGDAAFAGQGVVGETLNMSQLPGYRTGGTVHIVINNQLGFTTSPAYGRTSGYATDAARSIEAPVFHVNGDDPEAVVRVARLAFDYRQAFHKDVVIDLICYRRHGHSEVDDPSITQPAMYDRIVARPSVRKLYAEALIRRGDISERQVEGALRDYRERLERAFVETQALSAPGHSPQRVIPGSARNATDTGSAGDAETEAAPQAPTAITEATARHVIAAQTIPPQGFTVHPRVLPQLRRRATMLDAGTIDWATAESLAIGALLLDGVPVRLTGQDSRRGTFGQRHAALTDRRTGLEHIPLSSLGASAADFAPYDSMLSELAALAFEYGYSLARPDALVLWEAQFGDFANGAQMVVDEYIASSEQKWGQRSGVTLLLPHGLEGQGPDHSSGRIERFLQLCAQGNMSVAVPSVPGNYFHLLRQQALGERERRRPLVVFTPKSMLRLKAATSPLRELTTGAFRAVLPDETADAARTRRVLVCSGKVFYDLDAHRRSSNLSDTAIVRVERLHPFPERELSAELARFPADAEVRWVQEEPENQGAWSFVGPRVRRPASRPVECVSRPPAPAPAVGSARRHADEQKALVASAFR
ncbi:MULTISPECIES: multifunctional oxoglutarate decarboxylase/oxoglutarate dehydrogenase thiamine pyrophosphate-binding subunit/dihydrolipoyllysine-residue succinyltransferase subunit [Streptomyces violaceusniger group]|uniref:Multifunctional oxoglutarate decarboxylase/oxoglutarate dehydrogenase thiamine pyrophosphate-binding subunit/dihydrolipoyllysine-residue succinyltransferase subunit n=2 Tax=Streptomyces javensis TaxID=114698 RepID=A0ABS0R7D1_9ACTN|nr:multifunctional oxoglutarate decarboxylase/oxoglutarate dehydrogenase thiamine pyrophosphate-binding subunit/dihydrolipoyllysine-residue succinyltransferase subunit [Streptomyces javensis]MBI0313307.1 multifunctional oxoglutarate decarboxylase/oxoglutarate dehydrogenase thiamine pyrophosphate-binding subunit/dihydrolipoyllysine-residue succinyltransferase subunit [Streptomyces javensis]